MTKTAWAHLHGITISSEEAGSNPSMMMDEKWAREASHFKVTLRRGARRMTIHYSQGSGHYGADPKLGSVLESLALDAASIDSSNGFEDWANEFGMGIEEPADRKRAQKSYTATKNEKTRLELFLGSELYEQLLTQTELE
jgi:hypothetical protein